MKAKAQRIAIARACGHFNPRQTENGGFVASYAQNDDGTFWGTHGIPDYPNDLNAMHEAEKILTNEQWSVYSPKLWLITHQPPATYECHATASQRAEAFLRTLNLWEQ
jgi:hypothetical protein